MYFVNTIAHLVHETVFTFNGSANKNMGDAFLVVWKIPDQISEMSGIKRRRSLYHSDNPLVGEIAAMSLFSFIKIY